MTMNPTSAVILFLLKILLSQQELHTPYEIAATASWSNSNRNLYINDRNSNDMRSISSMHVYEIMGS